MLFAAVDEYLHPTVRVFLVDVEEVIEVQVEFVVVFGGIGRDAAVAFEVGRSRFADVPGRRRAEGRRTVVDACCLVVRVSGLVVSVRVPHVAAVNLRRKKQCSSK